MRRVLVTGMSGTGKSSALAALRRRHELDASQPLDVVVAELVAIGSGSLPG